MVELHCRRIHMEQLLGVDLPRILDGFLVCINLTKLGLTWLEPRLYSNISKTVWFVAKEILWYHFIASLMVEEMWSYRPSITYLIEITYQGSLFSCHLRDTYIRTTTYLNYVQALLLCWSPLQAKIHSKYLTLSLILKRIDRQLYKYRNWCILKYWVLHIEHFYLLFWKIQVLFRNGGVGFIRTYKLTLYLN